MGGNIFTMDRKMFNSTVGRVWLCVAVFSCGALCHGIDSQMFGSLQTLPSFLNSFGTIIAAGRPAFTTDQLAQLNSVPWLGKFVGVFIFTWAVDYTGYKYGMLLGTAFQSVGVILEMATTKWQVFLAGRTLVYCAMGVYENVAPLYVAEIAPPSYRGFFLALYPVMNSLGGIIVQSTIEGVKNRADPSGWLIACAVQFFPFIGIFGGLYWCPESPRYLMQKGKKEQALHALQILRTPEDEANGWVDLELESIVQQIEIEKLKNGGAWLDCFRGTNLRRTIIIIHMWVGNQWSGNQFMNSYAPTLYVLLGRQSQAYVYTIAYSIAGLVSQLFCGLIIDRLGRRPILIIGCAFMAVFLFILAGLGSIPNPGVNALNMMVASIVLFKFFLASSLQEMNHTLSAELPALQLRRKTNSIGTSIDVVAAFAVTYSSPYLLTTRGANLGPRVGFIFGSLCVYFCIYSILFVPEVKGRSLEEIDEMFEQKLWAWQFNKIKGTGAAGAVTAHGQGKGTAVHAKGHELEAVDNQGEEDDVKGDMVHVDKV